MNLNLFFFLLFYTILACHYKQGDESKKNYPVALSLPDTTSLDSSNNGDLVAFTHLWDSLGMDTMWDFRKRYSALKLFESKFGSSTVAQVIINLSSLKSSTLGSVPHHWVQYDPTLISFADSIEEPEIRGKLYKNLIKIHAQKGFLKEAIEIHEQHYKDFNDLRDEYHLQKVDTIRKYYLAKLELDKQNLSADERLWFTGMIYFNLYNTIGPETEASSINMSFPFSFLNVLLKKYPHSTFADDALFTIVNHTEGSSHEGGDTGYNLEAIEEYKDILEHYPATTFRPAIYNKIAWLYFEAYVEYEDKYKMLLNAKTYADKLLKEYPDYNDSLNYENIHKYLQPAIDASTWRLTISSNRLVYNPNEPIIITYTLTNIAEKTKTIQILKNPSNANFITSVEFYKINNEGYSYLEPIPYPLQFDFAKIETAITYNHSYIETRDLKRWARNSYRQATFSLTEKGKYCIKAFFGFDEAQMSVPSNKICFSIGSD